MATLHDVFDQSPPPALRDRVTASLRERGVLAGGGRRLRPWMMLAAAAVIAVAVAIGKSVHVGAGDVPRYMMLLYEDSTFVADRPIGEIVVEYASWAATLQRAGVLVAGEKLADAPPVLIAQARPVSGISATPTGYFVIRAESMAAAERIARSSPHVRRGGTVSLQRIE